MNGVKLRAQAPVNPTAQRAACKRGHAGQLERRGLRAGQIFVVRSDRG